MLTITEKILFTIKSRNKMLIDVNTLVKKNLLNIKNLYKKHKTYNILSLTEVLIWL